MEKFELVERGGVLQLLAWSLSEDGPDVEASPRGTNGTGLPETDNPHPRLCR